MHKQLKIASVFVIALALSGCEFSNSLSSNSESLSGENGLGQPVIPEALNLKAQINEGAYAGMEVVRIDALEKKLVLSVPLPIPFGRPLRRNLDSSDIDGGFWEIRQYDINQWMLELHLPLSNFVAGKFDRIPAARLPNGQALPGIAAGELPGFALRWQDEDGDKELFLYLGGGTVAVFVPTRGFDPFFAINIPLRDQKQERVGWFSTVPETESYFGGIYMALLLPKQVAKWIADNLE